MTKEKKWNADKQYGKILTESWEKESEYTGKWQVHVECGELLVN